MTRHASTIEFTETMKGWFAAGATGSFEEAEKEGRDSGSPMQFTLTVRSNDVQALISKPEHEASITGTVTAPALSAQPLTVTEGTFNLFVENPSGVDVRNMVYRMKLASAEGPVFFFHGVKVIEDGSLLHLWPQTTTLYVTVYQGADDLAPARGKGVLHIHPTDFLHQMTTMKVANPDRRQQLEDTVRFGEFFAGVLYDTYGGVLAPEVYFDPDAPPREKRPLRVGAPEVHHFRTSDGVDLRLTRYQGGSKGPVLLVHGAGVSSLIFSTDLPDTNLVEFLYGHGYDVWLLDFRVSIALPASQEQWNGDQVATIDHPEAVAQVRKLTGAETVQAVVHCYGANTFFMAMLAGLQGVRSIFCSQIATNLITKTLTRLKSGLHMPNVLDALGIHSLTAFVDSDADWKSRLYDGVLRLVPVPEGEECHSPVCHRITFMYSLLYEHHQLGQRIHDNLHELFGIGNMATFEHLALMVREKKVVAHDGEDVYMPHLDRLALPISFVHGAENQCYVPESTQITYDLLRQKNGADLYARHVIPGYGHIDCMFGQNAARDIYPLVLDHLEKTL